jgi:hypothetical protein
VDMRIDESCLIKQAFKGQGLFCLLYTTVQ